MKFFKLLRKPCARKNYNFSPFFFCVLFNNNDNSAQPYRIRSIELQGIDIFRPKKHDSIKMAEFSHQKTKTDDCLISHKSDIRKIWISWKVQENQKMFSLENGVCRKYGKKSLYEKFQTWLSRQRDHARLYTIDKYMQTVL